MISLFICCLCGVGAIYSLFVSCWCYTEQLFVPVFLNLLSSGLFVFSSIVWFQIATKSLGW